MPSQHPSRQRPRARVRKPNIVADVVVAGLAVGIGRIDAAAVLDAVRALETTD